MKAFCIKCLAMREMDNLRYTERKNRNILIEGTCGVCGTKMTRLKGNSIVVNSAEIPLVGLARYSRDYAKIY